MDYPFQIAYVQPPPQVSRFVQQEGKSARTIGEAAGGYVRRSFVSLTNKTPSCAGRTECLGENKTVLKIEFFMLCTSFHFGLGLELSVNF